MAKSVPLPQKSRKYHQKIKTLRLLQPITSHELAVDHSSFWLVQIHYLSELHQILSVLRLSDGEERSFPEIMKTTPKN